MSRGHRRASQQPAAKRNDSRAIDHLRERVKRDPRDVHAWRQLGVLLRQARQYDEAATSLETVRRFAPDDGEAALLLGLVEMERGHATVAQGLLEQAAERLPASSEAPLALGRMAEACGDSGAATRHYGAALARAPRSPDLLISIGKGLLRLGEYQEALAAFVQASDIAPDFADAWANRALAHIWRTEYEEARAAFRRAMSLKPHAPSTLNNLAFAAQMLGEIRTGVALLEQALTVAPRYGVARAHLGKLLAELGQTAAARNHINEALASPGLPDDIRDAARGTLTILEEHERLQPALARAISHADPELLRAAIAATPESHTMADTGCLSLLAALATNLPPTGDLTAGFRPCAPPAPDWPAIEAHFAFHSGDTVEEVARSLALLKSAAPLGSAAAPSKHLEDLARFESTVRDVGNDPARPRDGVEWETWIRYLHAFLTWHRPEMLPGQFKSTQNLVRMNPLEKRAVPLRVAGTFRQFFEAVYGLAPPGAGRAALVYHAMAKIHGFVDGNGRLGRFLLNRELEAAGLGPIVIPDSLEAPLTDAMKSSRRSRDLREIIAVLIEANRFTVRLLDALSRPFNAAPADLTPHG
jgi:tetratricopeptide (TPR) repeat protein